MARLNALSSILFLCGIQQALTLHYATCYNSTQYSVYDNTLSSQQNGSVVNLRKFKGNVSIAVNVATYCGLTKSQYHSLNALLQDYKDKPLVVLAFPSNQFGLQEPGTDLEIYNGIRYVRPGHGYVPDPNINFFTKVEVNGQNEEQLYKKMKASCPTVGNLIGSKTEFFWDPIRGNDITWNFNKFLLDKKGVPRFRFESSTLPIDLKPWINQLLSESYTPVMGDSSTVGRLRELINELLDD